MNKDFDLDNEFVSKPRDKLNYRALALAAAMFGFVLLSWYAYQAFSPDEEVYDIPLIESDSEITKIKPLDPGGIQMSNMDKDIYNNISHENLESNKEKLLPLPEEPIKTNSQNENLDELLKPLSEEVEKISSETQVSHTPDLVDNNITTDVKSETPLQQQKPLAKENETPSSLEIKEEKTLEQKPEIINVTGKKSLSKIAEKKILSTSTPNGKYRIQLASMKSEKDAAKEWLRLRAKYKASIGSMSPSLEKRNLGNKGTYYCIHAGSFKNYNAAHNVCKQLISKKQNCIVLENK